MNNQNRNQYLEAIKHITRSNPYSIHKSYFDNKAENALYLHLHPEMEFLYLEEGRLTFQIEEKRYEMEEGDAIFIPSNLLHTAYARSEKGIFRAVCFAPEYLIQTTEKREFQHYVLPLLNSGTDYAVVLKREEWQKQILEILKVMFYKTEELAESVLLIRGYLLVIWQYLYQYHISNILGEQEKNERDERIEEALSYIHLHFTEDIELEMLAKAAHMSEGQFCRSFKKAMGSTPFAYLKRYRILKSCLYLSETDKKISEICGLCGFNNISYYNREFLQIMKTTPSKYRSETRYYYGMTM